MCFIFSRSIVKHTWHINLYFSIKIIISESSGMVARMSQIELTISCITYCIGFHHYSLPSLYKGCRGCFGEGRRAGGEEGPALLLPTAWLREQVEGVISFRGFRSRSGMNRSSSFHQGGFRVSCIWNIKDRMGWFIFPSSCYPALPSPSPPPSQECPGQTVPAVLESVQSPPGLVLTTYLRGEVT